MRLPKTTFTFAAMLILSGCAQTAPSAHDARNAKPAAWNAEAATRSLVGTWTVDLRGGPDGAPYTQPLAVTAVDVTGRAIKGSFYGAEISWSRVNTAWGKLVVTFVTSDGQGEYTHAATLAGETLVGTSTAKHRNMLVPWTARREASR